ncbi:hypothetical protein E5288_WYG020198 [Bos mutus]|uniref:Uncharacterized protein n=1 Tax=Bos mutus TaxID=72004 RepID=A0A6B0S7Y9_9CETA|nr:hypothetical protein [Bos mutus]
MRLSLRTATRFGKSSYRGEAAWYGSQFQVMGADAGKMGKINVLSRKSNEMSICDSILRVNLVSKNLHGTFDFHESVPYKILAADLFPRTTENDRVPVSLLVLQQTVEHLIPGKTQCEMSPVPPPSSLTFNGYEGTKPYVILRLEQEEAPWICEAACLGCHCWENIWQVKVHRKRRQDMLLRQGPFISRKMFPKERSHECNKCGKISHLSTDLFPSIQNSSNWDSCGKSVNNNLDLTGFKKNYSKKQDECYGYEKLLQHTKHDRRQNEEKFWECSHCEKAFSHSPALMYKPPTTNSLVYKRDYTYNLETGGD